MSENNIKNQQIDFIICTNSEEYFNECSFYINSCKVPEGMSVSIIAINDAISMTSGYNRAMNKSTAKYKVYLHQDTFILNRNFIFDLLKCFNDFSLVEEMCEEMKKNEEFYYQKICKKS